MKTVPPRLRTAFLAALVTTTVAVALSPGVAVAAPGTVAADDAPPTIVSQPRATSATLLLDARFAVKATGENLTYQWQRRIGSTWVVIDKPSMPSMWLRRVQIVDDATAFRVRVSNSAGTVTSRPAILDVTPTITTTTISIDRAGHVYGAPKEERGLVTISVDSNNGTQTRGIVTLFAGSTRIEQVNVGTDGRGKARVKAGLAKGSYPITAVYFPAYDDWISGSTSNAITYTVS